MSMRKHRSPGLLGTKKAHTQCEYPRRLGKGHTKWAQGVTPEGLDFGCGSAALDFNNV
jgi:hypothetical protein